MRGWLEALGSVPLPCHHQANLADHPESIPTSCLSPLSCPSPLCLPSAESLPLLSALGCVSCRSRVSAAPRRSCPCLSCTMTIPAPGLGLSIFIQSKVSASLSRPVVEATLEGMVGILRLSHSQAGVNASVGGGQDRGWQTGDCLVSVSAEWLT